MTSKPAAPKTTAPKAAAPRATPKPTGPTAPKPAAPGATGPTAAKAAKPAARRAAGASTRKGKPAPAAAPLSPRDPAAAPLLALGDEAMEGLSAGSAAAARRLFTALAGADSVGELGFADAIDGLLNLYERDMASGVVRFSEALRQVSEGAGEAHMLTVVRWRAVIIEGRVAWRHERYQESRKLHEKAAKGLAELQGDRAHELWSYAQQQALRACLQGEPDARDRAHAEALLDELMEAVERRPNTYTRNRGLEATLVWEKTRSGVETAPERLERAGRALALPRGEANGLTWAFVLDLLGRKALSLRELGRHGEALEACREAQGLLGKALTDGARESAAWALAEGAYIAADLCKSPADALPFIASLRKLFGKSRREAEVAELAYGVAMEAQCHLTLGRLDEAQASLAELSTQTARFPKNRAMRSARVTGEVLRGDLLLAQGDEKGARKVWKDVVKKYAKDTEKACRTEADKASQRLQGQAQ